ncbi:PEP-CTERM sorting domain-containing protein [Pseudoduganella dura]|uniref:PEP-CTERM sorting domain-containing protein n=1 Tax=Pseudoduganella dura TaxID=321982 RepID=UPI0019BB4709|nr:PEP-CTERM sorting domain-containing protein [Pseudoduganella dura]GGY11636.1 hypothetical protein GCM10007386_47410 [Pseudoduganella dura]
MKSTLTAALLGAFAFASASTQAASQAQATLSSISYELIDTDLNDGITPSLTFLYQNTNHRHAEVWTSYGNHAQNNGDGFSGAFASLNVPGESAIAMITGRDFVIPAALWSSAVVGDGTNFMNSAGTFITGSNQFYLSGNTQVKISTNASLSTRTDLATFGDYARASVYAGASLYANSQFLGASSEGLDSRLGYGGATGTSENLSETWNLLLDNNRSETAVGTFEFSSYLTVASQVPESNTYAMLLAGLGLLGFAARRRKA